VRLLAFLEYAAVIIGIIAIVAGQFFGLPKGVQLGVVVTGAGILVGGLEGIFTRRMPFRPADDAYEAYGGTPAFIVGLMALAAGAATIWAGYLLAEGQWHATVNYLMRRPAPALAAAGLFLIGVGVLMMLNPRGRTGWGWRLVIYVPRALVGLLLVGAGFTAIGLGAWEWFQPQAFDRFVADLPRALRRLGIPYPVRN
jgi:hypothetical protein